MDALTNKIRAIGGKLEDTSNQAIKSSAPRDRSHLGWNAFQNVSRDVCTKLAQERPGLGSAGRCQLAYY